MLTMFWFCAAKVGRFFESTKYFLIKFALFFCGEVRRGCDGLQKRSETDRKMEGKRSVITYGII